MLNTFALMLFCPVFIILLHPVSVFFMLCSHYRMNPTKMLRLAWTQKLAEHEIHSENAKGSSKRYSKSKKKKTTSKGKKRGR